MSKSVGKSLKRVDAYDKATGRAKYTDDLCGREALIVNVADKFCAVLEVSYLARIKRIRRWVPDAARFLPVSHPA